MTYLDPLASMVAAHSLVGIFWICTGHTIQTSPDDLVAPWVVVLRCGEWQTESCGLRRARWLVWAGVVTKEKGRVLCTSSTHGMHQRTREGSGDGCWDE